MTTITTEATKHFHPVAAAAGNNAPVAAADVKAIACSVVG
jgi:hypothetical protein